MGAGTGFFGSELKDEENPPYVFEQTKNQIITCSYQKVPKQLDRVIVVVILVWKERLIYFTSVLLSRGI